MSCTSEALVLVWRSALDLVDQPLLGFLGQFGGVWSGLDDLADVVRLAGQDVRAGVDADAQRAARQCVDASLGLQDGCCRPAGANAPDPPIVFPP